MRDVGHRGDVEHQPGSGCPGSRRRPRACSAGWRRRRPSGRWRRRSWSRCRTCFRFTASMVTVPPYSAPAATTWSPCCRIVISAIASAAMPLAAGHRGAAALQRRDAFLERRHRRVAQPRVDVAEGLQVEQRWPRGRRCRRRSWWSGRSAARARRWRHRGSGRRGSPGSRAELVVGMAFLRRAGAPRSRAC